MIILASLISYLTGSIPTAYIFGKLLKGIDIREHGSGNVGATNVFRVLGKKAGIAVLILDILKGLIVVTVLADLFQMKEIYERSLLAACVVAGHNWTIFLQFKGGKGIATGFGVLIGLTIKIAVIRPVLLWMIAIWILCFLITRFVSLSSIVAATALPIVMVLTNQSFAIICLGILFCVFVVIRHRPNIKRLLAGQENRVSFFKKGK